MTIPPLSETSAAPSRRSVAALVFVAVIMMLGSGFGCRTADVPPPGVPDTPFWYMVADTAVWFLPAESLAVVQIKEGSSPDTAQNILYALRDMGWRLTPERGPALRHGGSDQDLTQNAFQVERVEGAISPSTDWRRLVDAFSPGRSGGGESHFYSLMPGLVADSGQEPPRYYWPSCLMIVWSKHTTASAATAWIDSLQCEIVSSPQVADMYYLKRAWAVMIPPREHLFEWIRKLERDPRVLQAHPILATSEPPFPDIRLLNAIPPEPDSGIYMKMTPSVRTAYWASHFAENTIHGSRITRIPSQFNRFHLVITTTTMQPYDSALVRRMEGKLEGSYLHRIDAWIPYQKLPELAADTGVTTIAGITGIQTGP